MPLFRREPSCIGERARPHSSRLQLWVRALAIALVALFEIGSLTPCLFGAAVKGTVFDRFTGRALARALTTLLADADLRRRMGREGRRRALARFDWDQAAARFETLFRQATDRRAAHG